LIFFTPARDAHAASKALVVSVELRSADHPSGLERANDPVVDAEFPVPGNWRLMFPPPLVICSPVEERVLGSAESLPPAL
jgi:hypothetical protein